MKWDEPGFRKRSGGRKEPQRFVAEAAMLREFPQRWADLEVPEKGRELWDVAYNLRRSRFAALPMEEFEVRVDRGRLFCRYRGRFDREHPDWMMWCQRVAAEVPGIQSVSRVSAIISQMVGLGFVLVPPEDEDQLLG